MKIRELRIKVKELMHNQSEFESFLNLFSKNISRVGEFNNLMNLTARHIADLVEAQSVCIFTSDREGGFKAAGVTGPFPLFEKTAAYV